MSTGGEGLIQPNHVATQPQPPFPDDGGNADGAGSPPVDLIFCDVVEPLDAEDVTETGPVECVQEAGGCGGEGSGLRSVKEDQDHIGEDSHLRRCVDLQTLLK